MTTIAYDGRTLASDSQSCSSFIDPRGTVKIKRIDRGPYHGLMIGFSGETSVGQMLMNAAIEGREPKLKEEAAEVIICNGDSVIWMDENFEPVECGIPYAIGSGAAFAMGAMLAGASAKTAIEIAIRLDPSSGGEVQVLERI